MVHNPETDEPIGEYPDPNDERFWQLYLNYCQQNGLDPTPKDYQIWFDENYS